MKILVISNLCPPDYDGGFELSAFRNASLLRERGHDVQLVTSGFRPVFSGPKEDPPWVHRIFELARTPDAWSGATTFIEGKDERETKLRSLLRELPIRRQNMRLWRETLRLAPRNEATIGRWLNGREFDVAYVFGLHLIGTLLTLPLSQRSMPIVYHQGDDWLAARLRGNRLKRAVLATLHPISYHRGRRMDVSRLVLVSEFLRDHFVAAGFPRETTSVVYRGVEFALGDDVDRPRAEPPTFLAASRVAYYKGTHIAIRAAAALHRRDPQRPWRLQIAGTGARETLASLAQLVETEGVGSRVEFLGKLTRDETVARMREATAFVSPSVFGEPLGNTNLEALAAGTPLLASRTGAMAEIVDDGVSGLTYDKADHEALAALMGRILDDPSLARRLALGGLKRVRERFTMDRVLDQVEAKLMEACGTPPCQRMEVDAATR